MIWTNITTGTPVRATNAKTLSGALPGRTLAVRASHPGSGPDALLKVVNASGVVVSQLPLSAARPEPPEDLFEPVGDANGAYNYILEPVGATWPSPGIAFQIATKETIDAASYDPATQTTAFDGPVVAESFQATDGAQDFFPAYASGVPAVASLQILGNQSQRVALPSGCTAFRLTFRGYGPFAYRLGSSDVVAVATDAPGLIDPTIVVPALPGATHIAVYGVDGGVGSLVVEGGSALPKTGFIPAYSGGVPKVVAIPFNAGETGAAVALPTDCTALRITTRNYGPAAYRLGGASVAAVATDAPADVLSPVVIPILPGATHISVYGLGTGIMVLEGGNKA